MSESFEKAMLLLIVVGIAFGAAVAIGIEHGVVWIYHHLRILRI